MRFKPREHVRLNLLKNNLKKWPFNLFFHQTKQKKANKIFYNDYKKFSSKHT